MNKKIILSTVASVSLCSLLSADTFTFDGFSDGNTTNLWNGNENNRWYNFGTNDTNDGQYYKTGIDGGGIYVKDSNDAVKINFRISDGDNINATSIQINKPSNNATLKFSTSDGSNSDVLYTTTGTGVTTVDLNWNNISSFSIEASSGTFYELYIDNLVFTNVSNIYDSALLGGAKANAIRTARFLQDLDDAGTYSQMDSVFTKLNTLTTDTAVVQAVEETTPQTATSSLSASNHISQGISGIVSQRQNANLGGGLNSGDGMFSEKNMWIKPYGSIGSQNDKDGINGFDIDTYGLAFGVDGEYEENQTFGLGFFYTKANVDVNNVEQSSDLDVFSLVAYGSNPIIDDKTTFMYQVGYSLQKNDSSRFVSLTSDTASANYTSKTASVDLKVLRDYRINDNLLLQPMVSTTYRHFKNPSYSESGAGALNLDVESFSTSELLVGLGTIVHYKLNKSSKIIGNVNVDYDLHDNAQTVTSSYQGATGVTFDTDGIDNGRVSYDIGLAYENQITDLSNINFSYNYQGKGSDYSNNIISAKYTYKF